MSDERMQLLEGVADASRGYLQTGGANTIVRALRALDAYETSATAGVRVPTPSSPPAGSTSRRTDAVEESGTLCPCGHTQGEHDPPYGCGVPRCHCTAYGYRPHAAALGDVAVAARVAAQQVDGPARAALIALAVELER